MDAKLLKVYKNSFDLSDRSNSFNIMRIFLATLVLISHSFELLTLESPRIFNRSLGNFAVHCFFIISGYFITKSWIRSSNAITFIKKRTFRLLPAYLVAVVLARVLAYIGKDYVICPTPYIRNGPVWTLYYEIVAYVLVMTLGCLGLIYSSVLGTLWIVGLLIIMVINGNNSTEYTIVAPLFLNFLGGAYISQMESQIKLKRVGMVCSILLLIIQIFPQFLFGLVTKMPLIYGPSWNYVIFNYYVYLICLPFSIIYLGKYFPVVVETEWDISYGMYIYAWPIQQIIIYFSVLRGECKPVILLLVSLVITMTISVLSYLFVERKIKYKPL